MSQKKVFSPIRYEMTSILLMLFSFVACQDGSLDWVVDCYDSENTTTPQTDCHTVIHCNCLLCAKNDPNSRTHYCVYATNTTMRVDNATWYCPSYDANTIQECRKEHYNNAIFYFGTWLLCVGICIIGCTVFVCRSVYAAIIDRRTRRNGFTQL